jgi:hypothetical protein
MESLRDDPTRKCGVWAPGTLKNCHPFHKMRGKGRAALKLSLKNR